MDDKIAQLILDELFSSLEALETQSGAMLQFLKDKGIAADNELVLYMEQAGMASSVKRRAARMRINYLVSAITNPPKKAVETEPAKAEEKSQKQKPEAIAEQSHGKSQEDTPEAEKTAADEKTAKDKAGTEKIVKTAESVQQEKRKTAKSDDETRANAKAKPDDEKSTDTEHEVKDSKGGSGKSATKATTPSA
jgi:hypothetical protein